MSSDFFDILVRSQAFVQWSGKLGSDEVAFFGVAITDPMTGEPPAGHPRERTAGRQQAYQPGFTHSRR